MKRLKIQNLILIQSAVLEFGSGLNILTGETGSGKSAVLSAIRLISGERADTSCIRKGSDMAIVEAEFEDGSILRREIYRSGKNRCFIDDAQVSLAVLKESVQIEMVDQSSSILGQEKQLLDQFAHISEEVKAYEASNSEEKALENELNSLLATPKERELEWAKKDLDLIEEVRWKEEEKLSAEHHLLTHAQELAEKIGMAASIFEEGMPNFKRALSSLEHSIRFDAKLQPIAQSVKSALLELEEAHQSIQSYADRIEVNPARLEALEREIGSIVTLKRRFGPDIEAQKEKLNATIEHLTNIDVRIDALQKSLATLKEKNKTWSQSITGKRKKAAPQFSSLILDELKSLNIPNAQFEVSIDAQIEFLFSANPGHPPIPIEKCASGGELSRLLLAIKTILSEGKSTLVFDEIDSNVGGQTASAIGEKLKRISQFRQVICVTHFVQVAKCGKDHFLVSKEARDESTYTIVQKMGEKEKMREYNRMMGCKT
ncbi:MAG: AAA family ATPase [Parachlamydiales bacterium]|nr:AAA family ATPase [Parachlamydiales bacterium]